MVETYVVVADGVEVSVSPVQRLAALGTALAKLDQGGVRELRVLDARTFEHRASWRRRGGGYVVESVAGWL
ncbi:MAG: hypothetical protein RL385_8 [Pseudomonadota bacterium]|jgi:hypothetical protein